MNLTLLYENGPCLVIDKPAGVLTQAPAGIDSVEARLRDLLGKRGGDDGYVGVVHRLDRPVTGALVVGLTRKAAWKLSRQFEERWVRKEYWACVAGSVDPPAGTWIDRLRKVPDEPRAELHPEGREAVLHYATLATGGAATLLRVELATGRMHQIRLQAASRGHAVLGDAQYGSVVPFGPQADDARLRAIALHARALAFRDPTSREDVVVTAPLPAPWQGLDLVPPAD